MKINKRIIFGVVFVDQIAKFALTRQNFFTLKVVENPGLPFGTNLGFFNFILLLLVLGVQFFSLGFIGELISRATEEKRELK